MKDVLRKSGIEVIGRVPWGTHFCQFYRTKQDLIDILVPYFKAGLENNEFCMWITAEPLKTTGARAALRRAVPDLDRYIEKRQIEIIPHTKWYLLGGKFDDERVLNGWVSKLEQALDRGYSGLRLTGNTFWLERNGWQAFTDYEAKVNNVIGKYRMLAICTYCLDKCDGASVVDVVKNHQFALIKEKGTWDIIESTIYKQAKEALLETEEQLRLALDSAKLGTFDYDLKARVVHWDENTKRMCGIPGGYDPTYEEVTEFLHPDDRKQVEAALVKAFAPDADGSYEAEFRIIRPDGSVIWNHANGKVFFEGEGSNRKAVRQIGINQDITERKKVEAALQESQQDLNHAQAVAYTGSWRLNIQRNELLWSEETYRIFGVSKGTPMTYETFLSCIHPDDREYVDRAWQAALQGEDYDIEHRIIVGNEVKWVREKAEMEFDQQRMLKGGFGTVQDITERKQSEEELRQTRDYLDSLFAYASAPIIVWNPELKITRFNHAFERLTGRSTDEMLGRKVDILIPADKRDEALKKINHITIEGERWETVEVPIQHVDGSVYTVLWNSATLFDTDGKTPLSTIAQGQDITERKQSEEELRHSQDELSAILANVPVMLFVVDSERRIIKVNDAAARFAGRPVEEMVGMRNGDALSCLNSLDDAQGCGFGPSCQTCKVRQTVLNTLETGNAYHQVEWSLPFVQEGIRRELTFLVSTVPMNAAEQQVLVCIEDITERKKIEKMKDEFISLVSHELRTPLTVITGSLLSAMSPGISPEDARELIQNAVEGADSLAAILENMLELSRHQADRLQLRMELVNIADATQAVIQRLKEQGIGQQFMMDFPADLPPVEADPVRVERIIYNLVENATKYSPVKSEIKVSARKEGDFIITEIIDHGHGISPEDRDRLFELFGRLEKGKRPIRGLGLGLVVCQRLIEAQGGWIKVDSEVGRGSTFSFALPIHKMKA
jgi:PAS domain S-box-containing protein